ncbi:hypothetical protein OROMI_033443 [Orobanche minor]
MAFRLRRVISLSYPLLHHSIHHPRPISSISSHLFSLTISNRSPTATALPSSTQLTRPFTSTSRLFRKTFDPETDEIGPDSILFEGCDYNHWLITVDFPKDSNLTREQMIETYVNIAAQIFGSVEEAKKNIYALSTTTYVGFQVLCSEETSEKFKSIPGVVFVLPDSYIDPVNKEYGGDKYVNGEIFPRPPPVHYGRRDNRDVRRRDNYGPPQRMNYGPPPPQQNRGPPTPPQNYGPPTPPQNYGPPTLPQNYGPPTPPQNYGPPTPPQNYGPPTPPQNYGPPTPPQNFIPPTPPQNFVPPTPPKNFVPPTPPKNFVPPTLPQNFVPPASPQNYGPPTPPQNYGVPMQNSPPQKYGLLQQGNPGSPQLQQSYAPSQQQNYGPSSRQNSGPLPPQQNYEAPPAPKQYGSPPLRNHGSPQPQQNYEPSQQQNYGPSARLNSGPTAPNQNSGSPPQQSYGNYSSPSPQQTYVPQGSGDRRSFTSPSNAYQGNFNQSEPGNRYAEGPRDYQQGSFQSHVSPEQRGFAQDATYESSRGGRVEQVSGGQRNFSSTGNN